MVKVKINKAKCKGCYLCVANCPNGCIKVEKDLNAKGIKGVYFSGGKCAGCGMCVVICPESAIEVYKSI